MVSLLLAALAWLAPTPQDPPRPPEPERIAAAVSALEAAFKTGEMADRIGAIRAGSEVLDARVVAWIAKGLKGKEPAVRVEAIEALGRMPHPESLAALQSFYRVEKKRLRKDPALLPRVLNALSAQGNPAAIEILLDDVQAQMIDRTLRARFYGLARIRSEKSIDAVLDLMKLVGFIEIYTYAEDFRLALVILTGEDLGRDHDAWSAWWNANRKTFKVDPRMPKLQGGDWTRWSDYWGLPPKQPGAEGEPPPKPPSEPPDRGR
jgi:HEAT repeat protein